MQAPGQYGRKPGSKKVIWPIPPVLYIKVPTRLSLLHLSLELWLWVCITERLLSLFKDFNNNDLSVNSGFCVFSKLGFCTLWRINHTYINYSLQISS